MEHSGLLAWKAVACLRHEFIKTESKSGIQKFGGSV
jgi:hypothetical protein